MFGHGLFQTRASMAAQIKTQAVTIGELSELVAKQAADLEATKAARKVTEGIFNARIRELTSDRDLALSARDELAEQVRKLTPLRGKGGRFEAKARRLEAVELPARLVASRDRLIEDQGFAATSAGEAAHA